jgi:dTDP-glucose 4,6-dehydratase
MKHVIITGGAGFIGSAMVGKLIAEGVKPIVLDKLTYAGHRENLAEFPASSYELVVGDIADQPLVGGLFAKYQPAAVLHLAAESHVDNSITGPQAFIQTNVVGNFLLLQSALNYFKTLSGSTKEAFRFVQVSTDEVYGSLGAEGHFTEHSQIQPNSPYSASKAAGDHLARAWHHTFGLPVITTHCSNNYGPRQFPEKLIPVMIHKALAGEKLPIYGNGSNVRDWIFVDDHCHGIWLSLTKGRVGEVYNFGGRAEFDNLSLVKKLCTLLDHLQPRADKKSYVEQIGFVTDRLGHDQRYAIDDSKAEQELGFSRSMTIDEGLHATVKWYLENQQWCNTVKKVA